MITPLFKRVSIMLLIAAFFVVTGTSIAADEVSGRKVKTRISPQYPELARRVNARGTVKIEITIAPNGSVKNTKVIGGPPLLIPAAEDAVKKWKYEPASEETTTVVEFNFTPGM